MSNSLRREMLHNILIKFDIPMKLIWLIKMYLHETCCKVSTGKHFSDTSHIQNDLKQENALLSLLVNFALKCAIRKVQENQ
jgi:hypothetical protein